LRAFIPKEPKWGLDKKGEIKMPKYLPPVKAIKKFCYECSGRSAKERELCNETDCPLFPYRLGNNPNRSGIGGRKVQSTPKIKIYLKKDNLS